MSCDDVHGVFDVNAFKHAVIGVYDQPRDRTDKPLGRIDRMCQRVLNRSTTGFVPRVVDVSIRGPVQREMLPRCQHDVDRPAKATGIDRLFHLDDCRMDSSDVRDRSDQVV